MPRVPTTITCCTTRDRLGPVRNRSDCVVKKIPAIKSATSGPSVVRLSPGGREERGRIAALASGTPWVMVSGMADASAPAVVEAEGRILGIDARLRLVGDQRHTRVGVAADFLARLREVDHRVHPLHRHLKRILLGRGGDGSVLDRTYAGAPAVN